MYHFEVPLIGRQVAVTTSPPRGDRTIVATTVTVCDGIVATRGILHRWYKERSTLVRGPTLIAFRRGARA